MQQLNSPLEKAIGMQKITGTCQKITIFPYSKDFDKNAFIWTFAQREGCDEKFNFILDLFNVSMSTLKLMKV